MLRIAARIYHDDFPGLHGRHDLESVVSEVWMRLVIALEATVPRTGWMDRIHPSDVTGQSSGAADERPRRGLTAHSPIRGRHPGR